MEKMLPEVFFRSHRSCIVNIAYIDSLEKNQITTVTGHQFPIVRNKFGELKKLLLEMPRITIPNCGM
ncbi:MAG: LytTR family transcriptional regulator [Bacteroidales bacterium]|nr:LytTR family transcriptional regulator [Bacteroidales bacterium]